MEFLNKEIKQAVITLGGKGSRLLDVTKNIPKPLWKINGVHTLERSIQILSRQGIDKYIWITGYKHELFLQEAKRISIEYNIDVYIHKENTPKGEAGSIFDFLDRLDNEFIFLNGDIIFDLDLIKLISFHNRNNSHITFITHLTNHPEDSDCIIESPSLSISKYKFKNEESSTNGFYLGNAGLSIISKYALDTIKNMYSKDKKNISLFKDIIVLAHENNLNVYSYNTSEYLKDMGTPNRLLTVKNDIIQGEVAKRSYKNIQKALFIDRDNTLNECMQGEYIININQIKLFEERISKFTQIAKNFDLVILITNQPQISMGKVSWQEVIEINGEIISRCQSFGLNISCFYLCPHHPSTGFDGEIYSLKSSCFCRKPLPGLFLEASNNKNIDFKKSLMIGDSWRDREASEALNMDFLDVSTLD